VNRPEYPAVLSEKLESDLSEDLPTDEQETLAHHAALNTTHALLLNYAELKPVNIHNYNIVMHDVSS